MKLAAFIVGGAAKVGMLHDADTLVELDVPDPRRGILGIVERGGMPRRVAEHRLRDVELCAPIPRPARNIMCIGKNYRAHAAEFAGSGYDSGSSEPVPDRPIVFTKAPSAVTGPYATVHVPARVTTEVDYEAEFAVIIGTGGRAIAKHEAMQHVWGYTLLNDLTARDLQRDHKQWFLGKSLDGFAPMGPWAVTADDVDLGDLTLSATVNGELRQKACARDLIFGVPTLIETISAVLTLEPGDIIATGTPAGVGIGYTPPRFLRDKDCVEISADYLGAQRITISIATKPLRYI